MQVDKNQFKVGSLDQLMSMNEQASKMDQQLDLACKKYEKICFDNGAKQEQFQFKDDMTEKTSK